MNIKDELKKIIEEMDNTMAIIEKCASKGLFIKASRLKLQINNSNYESNLIELERLMTLNPEPGTLEDAKLASLAEALLKYEQKRFKRFFASTYIKGKSKC